MNSDFEEKPSAARLFVGGDESGCIREEMPAGLVDRPAGMDRCLFAYFYSEIFVEERGKRQWVASPSLIIWEPHCLHYYGHPHQPWIHSWVLCDYALVKELLCASKLELNRIISLEDSSLVEKYLADLFSEYGEHREPDPVIVTNIFDNWIREIARAIDYKSRDIQVPKKYVEVKQYLETNYFRETTLEDLARRVPHSPQHFCSEFKKYFGQAPIEYLIRLRLRQARLLLRDHNLRISEIGRRVGYDDVYYFSRCFKKYFGLSPQAMRLRKTGRAGSLSGR